MRLQYSSVVSRNGWQRVWGIAQVAALGFMLAACGGGQNASSGLSAPQPEKLAQRPSTMDAGAAGKLHHAVLPEQAYAPQVARIAIRGAGAQKEFFDRRTGAAFTPQGYNYVKLAPQARVDGSIQTYHSTFNVGHYDKLAADSALDDMQRLGYNTVRVFVSVCCVGGVSQATGGLNPEYLANMADFTRRAKAKNVSVLITSDGWLPAGYAGQPSEQDKPFAMINSVFFSRAGVQGTARFWRDLVTGLRDAGAALDSVLAYSVANEAFADTAQGPFPYASTVTAANGKSYNLANAGQRDALISEGMAYFAKEVGRSIRQAEPTALVTMGFFTPNAPHVFMPGDMRVVPKLFPALNASDLDFVDLHLYPAFRLGMREQAENIGLTQAHGPLLIMGEFGALRTEAFTPTEAAEQLHGWRAASCEYGFQGWLMWTWDIPSASENQWWTAIGADQAIATQLSPKGKPAVCAASRTPPTHEVVA
jgi:hypothetical protein